MTSEHENDERDELVSETYRDLGIEQAPEHLNQSILRMAASDGKRGRSNGRLLGAWTKPLAWAATIGLSLAIVLEVTQLPTPDNQATSEESTQLEEPLNKPVAVYEQEARELGSLQDANGPAREGKVVRRQVSARKRAADQTVIAEDFAAFAMSPAVVPADIDPACDSEIRTSQDDWQACIKDLRANGANVQADLEYEAYILEFPAESKAE